MTQPPDPTTTIQYPQSDIADLRDEFTQFKNLVNTQITAMSHEIHRLRQRATAQIQGPSR